MDDTLEKPREAHEERRALDESGFRPGDFIQALCEFTDPKQISARKENSVCHREEHE